LEAVCACCEKKEPYEPSDWFVHIWFIYCLQKSGYPFAANDLTVDEWLALGEIREAVEMERMMLMKTKPGE